MARGCRHAQLRDKMISSVQNCVCGGKLGRVHRTLQEKVYFMAVYQCKKCGTRATHPRGWMWYFARRNRCPRCGTERLKTLSQPDHIDRMSWNLFRPFARLGPTLFHCRYCRIQFYDMVRTPRG